jgi:hydroxymethylpyrimidine/phosphomethylpyrimidine kinase
MILISIAGFDPSGGAGVLLDAAVFRALGFDASAVLTSATVQNTSEVFQVKPLPPRFVRDQFQALSRDLTISGLKVGMTGSARNIRECGRLLSGFPALPRVVDPVLRASSGRSLSGSNLEEAARLSGRSVTTVSGMRDAATAIYDRTGVPCLIKGGHLPGNPVNLLYDGSRILRFAKSRIRRDVHGTGCLFSAALLAYLIRTGDLAEAAGSATDWAHRAIRTAAPIGRGRAVFSPRTLPLP